MDPLVTKGQLERVLEYIDIGKSEGAKLVKGGAVPKGLEKGCYVEPTLFTGVQNKMRIAQEEIFGPIGAVLSFNDIDDAIATVVWVNCFEHGDMTQPWGGYKQSGSGCLETLTHCTQTKSVWIHLG